MLLGPTVNIQRDPLTGRGFEMYSEDPFLSGTVATSYVKGVQSKGIAATMKHFLSAAVRVLIFADQSGLQRSRV